MDLFVVMRTFVRVVEAQSFTEVAREVGATQSSVTKQIAALERHLGARLLNRTTRSLTLTEDGRNYYEHCREVLDSITQATALIGQGRTAPTGLVRVGTPNGFGRLHVAPRIRRLLDKYPALRVELVMSDGFVDLVEQGLDVAIRSGELRDQSLVARRIGITRRVTVGSTEYFARYGEPRTPEDLTRHNCIVYTSLTTGDEWHFAGPNGGPVSVRVRGNFLADNSEAVREAVAAGVGIAVMPVWLFRDEITSGLVRAALPDFEPKRLPIYAVCPSRRFLPTKVRVLIDFFADEFKLDPHISTYGDDLSAISPGN
jgi:DNA-binding transcriptional LysR family regulator